MSGVFLRHGETECYLCRLGARLLNVDTAEPKYPERFTNIVHYHLRAGTDDGLNDGFQTIVSQDGTQITGTYDYDRGGVCTHWADAHLIAAAPDLLEALEECRKLIRGFYDYSLRPRAQRAEARARAAIAKATGGTP